MAKKNETPEAVPGTEVKHYTATELELIELEQTVNGLTIAGIDDKDGYKAVSATLSKAVKMRNQVVALRRDLKRQIDGQAEAILTRLEPLEKKCNELKAPIDAELERIRKEAEEKAYQQFIARTGSLLEIGFIQVGQLYSLGRLVFSADQINRSNDEEWQKLLTSAQQVAEEIRIKAEQEAAANAARDKELKELRAKLAALEAEKKQQEELVVEAPVDEEPQPELIAPDEDPQPEPEPKPVVQPKTQPNPTPRTSPVGSFRIAQPKPQPQPEPLPEQTAPTPKVADEQANEHFVTGFNAAKGHLIQHIKTAPQLTRTGLIDWVNNLQP